MLPADPAEQLDIACRLASLAFSTKASALETENVQLRQGLMQRQSQVKALERRVHDLEGENSTVREELTKLSSEKAALLSTIKRLNRDIARLDTFKRRVPCAPASACRCRRPCVEPHASPAPPQQPAPDSK